MEYTDAWILRPKGQGDSADLAQLSLEKLQLPDLGDNEVLVEPLYGCWEGNMFHALERKPVDICRLRKEERVVIGNAGVVRVLKAGSAVKVVRPEQIGIVFCVGEPDHFGYPVSIYGYDCPNSIGCLAKRTILKDFQIIPVPSNTIHDLKQWAGFSLRYVTAWSNWELASTVFRAQVSKDELAAINVWGWGGGTTLAELTLAHKQGHRCVMLSGNDEHLNSISETGIKAIDRRQFPGLEFDQAKYAADPAYKAAYLDSESKFLSLVESLTNHRKVQIFVDYVGVPVFRPTLKALSRQGVVTTAGWKEGMELRLVRAIECIDRHQHVHSHYARNSQGWAAVAYAEANGWLPRITGKVYSFENIPELARDFKDGRADIFPIYQVNP